jgi:hypothetical protein
MIRTRIDPTQLSEADKRDTITHYQAEILKWEKFKLETTYFQEYATNNIQLLKAKIAALQ